MPFRGKAVKRGKAFPGSPDGRPKRVHTLVLKIIQKFQSLVKHELELIFLPPCSPKLNPIERLWKFMREWITHD
nr:transposase [Candidatus Sigynarchaeum springense]